MNFIIIVLIILTFVSRVIGLGREMVLAYFYGASSVSDAYFMSIAIPTIMVTFVIVSLAMSYVPAYQLVDGDHRSKNIFTNKVLGLTCAICLLIIVITLIFTPQIVPLFVAGFDQETTSLTVTLTRITLIAVVFMGMNHILHSFLQVKEKVLLASLSGLPYNLIAIIFIVLSFYTNIYLLAVGSIFALGIQFLYLMLLAARQGFKLKPRFDIKDKTIRNLMLLTLPIILANTAQQIGIMVDKNLASTFGHGAVSFLAYATRISTAVLGIIVTSFLVVTFPKFAKLVTVGNMTKMKNSLAESIVGMSLFIIPAIAGVAMFAHPIVLLLFGRGAFDTYAVQTTSSLLFFHIFFLFGEGLSQLVARIFFALGDSRTPMITTVITVVINIILNFVFITFMGIAGLALATSISAIIGILLLLFLLRRKIGSLRLRETLLSLNKITGASIACAFGAYFVYHYLAPFNALIALLIAAIVGTGIYCILLLILRIREVERFIAFTLNKIAKFYKS